MVAFFQTHKQDNRWLPKAEQEEGIGIRLGRHGRAVDGSILVGRMMGTPDDVDRLIDELIANLEQVRREAKLELAAGAG